MSARRSARIKEIPKISYQDASDDVSDHASDAEGGGGDEDDEDSFSPDSKSKAPRSKKKTRKDSTRDIFRWNDLSGELRNMIYEYALVEPTALYIEATKTAKMAKHFVRRARRYADKYRGTQQWRRPALGLGLLLLNKQTHKEAAPFLYSQNTFHMNSPRSLYFFLRPLAAQTKGWIRCIEVGNNAGGFWRAKAHWALPAFDALIAVANLEKLRLRLQNTPEDFYACAVLWIEHVGRKRGDRYAALRILDGLDGNEASSLKRLVG